MTRLMRAQWACSTPSQTRAPCCATPWASPRARLPGHAPSFLVGRVVPVAVLDPAERGACPDMVLKVGAPPRMAEAPPSRPHPQWGAGMGGGGQREGGG